MKKIKCVGVIMAAVMMAFALLASEVMAYSDVSFSVEQQLVGGPINFTGAGANTGSTFYFEPGKVYSANSPQRGAVTSASLDAIVGKWVNITTVGGVFTLGAGSGLIWDLGGQSGTISVTQRADGTGIQYFSGEVIAKTINFETGTIIWEPGTTLATINTTVNSYVLGILNNNDNDPHLAAISSMTFDYASLGGPGGWITATDPAATGAAGYMATVTVTPEPGEWALMLVGLGLIGFSIYRKNTQFELVETLDFRMS